MNDITEGLQSVDLDDNDIEVATADPALVLPAAAEKKLATAKDADTVAKRTRHYASVIEGLDGDEMEELMMSKSIKPSTKSATAWAMGKLMFVQEHRALEDGQPMWPADVFGIVDPAVDWRTKIRTPSPRMRMHTHCGTLDTALTTAAAEHLRPATTWSRRLRAEPAMELE